MKYLPKDRLPKSRNIIGTYRSAVSYLTLLFHSRPQSCYQKTRQILSGLNTASSVVNDHFSSTCGMYQLPITVSLVFVSDFNVIAIIRE